jgi:hypothetical protein
MRWTPARDEQLRQAVEIYGTKNWVMVSTRVPGTTGRSCRERWNVAGIPPRPFSQFDDIMLRCWVMDLGMHWVIVGAKMGRRPSQVMMRWKKLHDEEQAKKKAALSEKQDIAWNLDINDFDNFVVDSISFDE